MSLGYKYYNVELFNGRICEAFESVKDACEWLVEKRYAKNIVAAKAGLYGALRGKARYYKGFEVSVNLVEDPLVLRMSEYHDTLSIELETRYGKWVSISSDYIMITDRPAAEIDWTSDEEIALHVAGFDRIDGEDYYKNYVDERIVALIDTLIRDLKL
jgi:hypothetical protein